MDQEFENIDSSGQWQNLYNEIRNQSQECPYKVAKFPENRNRNRYRDVSPYDHSRVRLENSENDYINASLITMEEAQRRYILTQGPLRNTCGHFWQMIWEQRCKAVIMLNRVIEKGSEKCAQYWPSEQERDMDFSDTGFVVTLVSEDVKPNYTIRLLELRNGKTGETREIYHFNYTTWPDFGVPESPASFLNFPVAVGPKCPCLLEDGREGEAVFGICQTVVAGVLGNSTLTPVQAGEDLCTGDLMLLSNVLLSVAIYW
uniref:protein-tyrosine-phosphatase n=1 Tax=Sinocyclocheilus grahami TaxID=75366 RepID=A0A672PK51_SINGR